jgi:uncharacterized membrane protein
MHLIPQSASHFHLLVSIFPSIGLIFVLGFYVTAFATDDAATKRSCLVLFGVLGLLAIPTYISGDRSMAVLSSDPKISQDLMSIHFGWGVTALALLVLTGAAALIELWRSRRAERLSNDALHLVLGLALVTLALMVITGEVGWEINHHELRLDPVTQRTPQAWSHVHIILNHFPTVGFVFALVFYIAALVMNNVVMKRASLVVFVICAILGVPTYVTGAASMWALTGVPGISRAAINAHRDMALWTLFGLAFTGVTAWIELWRFRHLGRFSNRSLYLVLAFAIITLGVMAETGHRGGQINHPEIHVATDPLPTDPKAGLSPAIESLINHVIWFVPWQTVHFFGFSLIFGTALAVLEILAVLCRAPDTPLGSLRSGDECFQRNAHFVRRFFSLSERDHIRAEDCADYDRRDRRLVFLVVRTALDGQGGRGCADERQVGRRLGPAVLGRRDHGRPADRVCVRER